MFSDPTRKSDGFTLCRPDFQLWYFAGGTSPTVNDLKKEVFMFLCGYAH
ncbi:hypothetical protein SAMN06269173_12330 [Hymenobacter mucosus]|uniref:Uncharacterized protein n=1 Tax=Hymenobacter mucosus TaxID=1411120 RepID=A0A239BH59_9BACT|nr:hypothetical protein SAMN06269173_12330 [Hymenobacter mucosus]